VRIVLPLRVSTQQSRTEEHMNAKTALLVTGDEDIETSGYRLGDVSEVEFIRLVLSRMSAGSKSPPDIGSTHG